MLGANIQTLIKANLTRNFGSKINLLNQLVLPVLLNPPNLPILPVLPNLLVLSN